MGCTDCMSVPRSLITYIPGKKWPGLRKSKSARSRLGIHIVGIYGTRIPCLSGNVPCETSNSMPRSVQCSAVQSCTANNLELDTVLPPSSLGTLGSHGEGDLRHWLSSGFDQKLKPLLSAFPLVSAISKNKFIFYFTHSSKFIYGECNFYPQ